MSDEMIPVGRDDILPFRCGPDNECFNECCRDLNQFLTPYDIMRLKQHLGLRSAEFLKTYTALHTGPESGLPVVTFKPNPDQGYACPFVSSEGCTVYENRPASCRMYPLARAVARSRETGELTEYFALIEEDHCKGFSDQGGQTVGSWLEGQEVDAYNRVNDRLMEIISLKNSVRPGRLEGALADKFYLALYDLDTFRAEIFENQLLEDLDVPADILDRIRADDASLLSFGLIWVRHVLFGREMDYTEMA
ncbi:MAG: YkgJ family cysteine cluster protein [Desulfobacteraceae bacterium]|nr:MAG: YkgJ family cysteine cluster protein [Desulfobacteraceae bacterium]